MADEQDSDQGEKTEEPTQHRIDEFRKKGEVASSKELNNILVLSASVLTIALTSVFIYEEMSKFAEWIFTLDVREIYKPHAFKTLVTNTVWTALKCVAPIFAVVIVAGVLSNVGQIGFLYAPEVLEFKPERINPISGFKKLFSKKALVEAAKGILKFIFVMSICYYSFKDEVNSFSGFFHVDFFSGFVYGKALIIRTVFYILGGLLLVALGDFAFVKYQYIQKLKMTKEQSKRETKEQEGNPEIKQRIRTIQREMAQKRMMADVPNADVIITNPTHISVALKYDQMTMISPELVAKGADSVALKIREIAKQHNIPIVENVPLARTMYKTVKIGHTVPRSLYKAVAEVLAFVYKLKKKKKA